MSRPYERHNRKQIDANILYKQKLCKKNKSGLSTMQLTFTSRYQGAFSDAYKAFLGFSFWGEASPPEIPAGTLPLYSRWGHSLQIPGAPPSINS